MPEKKFGTMPEDGKLFIGGLTYRTTDDMLKDFYQQWGRLVDFIVMKDSETKRSRGFGFVTYADPKGAEMAMSCLPHVLDDKQVDPKWAMPRESDPAQQARPAAPKIDDKNVSVKRLFISGIKDEHTEPMFMEYFSEFGTILSMDIVMDKQTGRKRGFGYINYDSVEAVEKCIVNKSHMVGGLRCDVKKALSKDEMGARSGSQYGRDRMERDNRSRGTGRGDGYGYQGGYHGGGGYGQMSDGWNRQGGGFHGHQGYNQGMTNFSTAGSTGGPMTATYYPPSYGGGSTPSSGGGYSTSSSSYGSNSGGYPRGADGGYGGQVGAAPQYQPPPSAYGGADWTSNQAAKPASAITTYLAPSQQSSASSYNPPPVAQNYSYPQYGSQQSQGGTGGWQGQGPNTVYSARR